MKKLFALTVVLLGLIGLTQIAFAGPERLEAKEMKQVAPAPPPPCDWTGFYIGAHIGYGAGDLTWEDTDFGGSDNAEPFVHHTESGVLGGGQVGYNHQFGSWLVIGAEGDFAWSDIGETTSDAHTDAGSDIKTFDTQNDWIGTIALRLGISSWNNRLLAYVKGGAAIQHSEYGLVNDEVTEGNIDHFTADETRAVPMVGFGLEYAITCHWSAKLEYRHLFTDSYDISGTNIDDGSPDTEHYQIYPHQDSVSAGINFKF